MKNVLVIFSLFLLCFGAPFVVMGHGDGHSHEDISSSDAKLKATEKVSQLATAGKIDSSWVGIKPSGIEQKAPDHDMEWVVLFKNGKVSDTSKRNLYLFFSLDGDFITSNYDGN